MSLVPEHSLSDTQAGGRQLVHNPGQRKVCCKNACFSCCLFSKPVFLLCSYHASNWKRLKRMQPGDKALHLLHQNSVWANFMSQAAQWFHWDIKLKKKLTKMRKISRQAQKKKEKKPKSSLGNCRLYMWCKSLSSNYSWKCRFIQNFSAFLSVTSFL